MQIRSAESHVSGNYWNYLIYLCSMCFTLALIKCLHKSIILIYCFFFLVNKQPEKIHIRVNGVDGRSSQTLMNE